jgi:hypothetical protein
MNRYNILGLFGTTSVICIEFDFRIDQHSRFGCDIRRRFRIGVLCVFVSVAGLRQLFMSVAGLCQLLMSVDGLCQLLMSVADGLRQLLMSVAGLRRLLMSVAGLCRLLTTPHATADSRDDEITKPHNRIIIRRTSVGFI